MSTAADALSASGHQASADPGPATPDGLADYQVLTLAGRGAFGSVWVARDRTGILHALKVVDLARLSGHDPGEREEQALALVRQRVPRHPHIVEVFHVSRMGGRLVYAMDLADPAPGSPPAGQESSRADTLAQRIAANGRLPVEEAVRITLALLSALEALHAAGLVHRDVKPHNVVFVGGVPKLADVGLAAVVQTALSVAGTPGYLPLDGSTGPDADLYALGKLLYQGLTGRETGDFPSFPAELVSGPDAILYRRLNRLLLRACAPTRAERFATAAELRAALQAALNPSPLPWRKALLPGVIVLLLLASGWFLARWRTPAPADEHPARVAEAAAAPVFFRPGEDAHAAQAELARQIQQPLVDVNSLGMRLVLIPAGEFSMGSPENEEGHLANEYLHPVRITHPFTWAPTK